MAVEPSLVARYQQAVEELRAVVLSLQQYRARLLEIERVLKELEKLPDNYVYRSYGNILFRTPKEEVVKELTSEKELLQVRVEEFSKRERLLRERLSSLEKQLRGAQGA
uniref:Prefoldin subunit beta n=1 Tax=Thermofilum pendens TaxID=2269 RepID=A0A7C1T5H5_THEPE